MFEIKNLLMPLFLMRCFPMDFQEVKRPLQTKSGKRPIKVWKRPIKDGKRPIKAMVMVGISVVCWMGRFRAPPPWWKTASLKRPIKRPVFETMLSETVFDPFPDSGHLSILLRTWVGLLKDRFVVVKYIKRRSSGEAAAGSNVKSIGWNLSWGWGTVVLERARGTRQCGMCFFSPCNTGKMVLGATNS